VISQPGELVRLPVDHVDGPLQPAISRRPRNSLRRRLVLLDVSATALAWALAMWVPGLGSTQPPDRVRWAIYVVAVGCTWLNIIWQRLYLARVSSNRVVELSLLWKATMAGTFAAFLVSHFSGYPIIGLRLVLGGIQAMTALALARGIFGAWLRAGRISGMHLRPVVLVGANAEGYDLYELVDTHPELGMRVLGVTGSAADYDKFEWNAPYLGEATGTLDALSTTGSDGVIIASSAIDGEDLNSISRQLLAHDVHVHLSSGLQRVHQQRLRSLPLAHEPLFYLEPVALSPGRLLVKRAIDLVISSALLLLLSPVLLVSAIAIKINDGGPIFFRQRRIGRDGEEFTVFKLRTMVPDAEARLDDVLERLGNQRDDVLFKLDRDPRRTQVGRILESASLDEVPQLFNVLRGEMSLVGPRPALPREVEKFDEELLQRLSVPPGITGLWQVEARDNPSFSAYRRLDLFYVENWSLTLDFVLMFETASAVLARLVIPKRG
jgi:exopolysaccharide biosynthesis polyprenyl glycosylphosphotransferase